MANIKTKSLKELEAWNIKELRKLRITVKNRIESLKTGLKPKELSASHVLRGLEIGECQSLLEKIKRAEKALS